MSATRGDIVDSTLRALRRTLNDDDRTMVEGFVNRFYFDICYQVPIKALRRRVEIDLSDADYDDGIWLPSNMAGILRVQDEDDEFDYIERDRATIEESDSAYRYYTYVPTCGPAYYGDDGCISQAATTFTSDGLTTDYTDSYIKFGNEPGLYLLTAEKTFTPTYYGPNQSEVEFVIRPTNTEKIVAVDPDEDEITDATLLVDYWELPVPLYRNIDTPLLPSTRALELMVMKESMGIIGKRQLSSSTYERDIRAAMDELRKLCPVYSPTVKAKDVLNKTFTFATDVFTDRS